MKIIVSLPIGDGESQKTLDLITRLRRLPVVDGVMLVSLAAEVDTHAIKIAKRIKDATQEASTSAFHVGLRLSDGASADMAAMACFHHGLDFFGCGFDGLRKCGDSMAEFLEANTRVEIFADLSGTAHGQSAREAAALGFTPLVDDAGMDMSQMLALSVATGGEVVLAVGSDPEKATLDFYDFAGAMIIKQGDLIRHERLLMRATMDKAQQLPRMPQ